MSPIIHIAVVDDDEAMRHSLQWLLESSGYRINLYASADEFLQQHQVVVKPIDKNFRPVEGIGAATVRGDGSIGLILDVVGLIEVQKKIENGILTFNNYEQLAS